MDPQVFVLMEKEKDKGPIKGEVGRYVLDNPECVESLYMINEGDNQIIYLKLTIDKEIEDWEYYAILDYYDQDLFGNLILSIEELEDYYNPTWQVTLNMPQSQDDIEELLNEILDKHKEELHKVYEEVKNKKEEYME